MALVLILLGIAIPSFLLSRWILSTYANIRSTTTATLLSVVLAAILTVLISASLFYLFVEFVGVH